MDKGFDQNLFQAQRVGPVIGNRTWLWSWMALLFLALNVDALAQSSRFRVSGQVIDADTKESLPFVNITLNDNHTGTTTDIDGKFNIVSRQKPEKLNLSYVGYEFQVYMLTGQLIELQIKLKPKTVKLQEVPIFPGENPAHRIIKLATKNRKQNDPLQQDQFSYKSYNKVRYFLKDLGFESDEPLDKEDSAALGFIRLIQNQLIFLIESEAQTHYKKPDKRKDIILSTRTSGFKSPDLYSLPTDFQPLGFYETYINLLQKDYLNPISPGSTRKYLFQLKDTLYQNQDTVFVISYQPRKGKSFLGFKGLLYINTHGYAIQNVIAESADKSLTTFKVQQQFEFIEEGAWFPVQINADLNFDSLGVKAETRSYLKEISVTPSEEKTRFSHLVIETMEDAADKDSTYWDSIRPIALTSQEDLTYQLLDSMGEEFHFDKWLKIGSILAQGYLPLGKFQLNLARLYRFNNFEGSRIGIGVGTSDKFSKWFALEGYYGFGIRDQLSKYGASLTFNFDKRKEHQLIFDYGFDLMEPGRTELYDPIATTNLTFLRSFAINQMLRDEFVRARFKTRVFKFLAAEFSANMSTLYELDTLEYIGPSNVDLTPHYDFTETHIRLKYAYNEKFSYVLGSLFSYGTKYPELYFNYSRGWPVDGSIAYDRVVAGITYSARIRGFGKPAIAVFAGQTTGNVPRTHLSFAPGTKLKGNYYDLPYSFQTMQPYEFLNDRFLLLHYRHELARIKLKTQYSFPHFVAVGSAIYGTLENPDHHLNTTATDSREGYYEAGLLIDQLIRYPYVDIAHLGLGVAGYYRLGHYSLPRWQDNVAVRLNLTFNF